MSNKNVSKLVGDKGEDLACEYLVEKGYKILGRNYRVDFGEIDIIAQKKFTLLNKIRRILIPSQRDYSTGAIHFVEVKTLSYEGVFYPEERVDYKKKNKYKRLVEIWLAKNRKPFNYPCQVDIIAVAGDEIDFFENVVAN